MRLAVKYTLGLPAQLATVGCSGERWSAGKGRREEETDERNAELASTHHPSEVAARIRAKFTGMMSEKMILCQRERKERSPAPSLPCTPYLTLHGICQQLKKHLRGSNSGPVVTLIYAGRADALSIWEKQQI